MQVVTTKRLWYTRQLLDPEPKAATKLGQAPVVRQLVGGGNAESALVGVRVHVVRLHYRGGGRKHPERRERVRVQEG